MKTKVGERLKNLWCSKKLGHVRSVSSGLKRKSYGANVDVCCESLKYVVKSPMLLNDLITECVRKN